MIHGDKLGQRVDIGDGPAVVGRASDCALQIDHRSVSRHHCDHVGVGETVLKFERRDSLEARYHEALYELATVDSLTQLFNRRKFREHLDAAIEHARGGGTPLALLFLDIDHFKRINDRHGHIAGDELLRAKQSGRNRVCVAALPATT